MHREAQARLDGNTSTAEHYWKRLKLTVILEDKKSVSIENKESLVNTFS